MRLKNINTYSYTLGEGKMAGDRKKQNLEGGCVGRCTTRGVTSAPDLDPRPFAESFYNHIWSEEKAI
jgi:hypothetical protein